MQLGNNDFSSIILLFVLLFIVLTLFNYVTRKLLHVERPRSFSYNYVNSTHQKIDWWMRGVFTVLLVIVSYIVTTTDDVASFWQFIIFGLIITFLVVTELLRAFMEWKHADNQRAFLATLIELAFVIIIVTLLITTDSLGLF